MSHDLVYVHVLLHSGGCVHVVYRYDLIFGYMYHVDVYVIKPLEPSMDSSSSIHVPVDTIDEKLLTEAMNHLVQHLCIERPGLLFEY